MAYQKIIFHFLSISAFLYPIAATPTTSPASCPTLLATFDDLTTLNPTGPTQPIGTYKTLNFPGINLNTFLSTSPIGVVPQSGDKTALFNLETQIIDLAAGPAITVVNDGSTTKSFSLPSFYYGCAVASQEGLAGVPASCKMVLSGYTTAGTSVASQTFPYTFTSDRQGMALAKPNSQFQNNNLKNVTFSLGGEVVQTALVGLLDSVSIVACS